jgi:hypothetical protein
MMFIVRTYDKPPAGLIVKMQRQTPPQIAAGAPTTDFFCVGNAQAASAQGYAVVPVHDGWYADDSGGGIAIFGDGKFWEVRDTPFTVKEADETIVTSGSGSIDTEMVNVRGAIFGA